MEMECGKEFMVILTLGSGNAHELTVMGYMFGKTGTDTKANGKTVSNTDLGQIFLAMEMSILDIMSMENLMGKDNTHGQMEAYMLERLKMA